MKKSEDRFFDRIPCILITGKGFSDLATRILARKLKTRLEIPVLILSDSNPFGLAIALTYMLGSARMPIDSQRYIVHALWIGLLPSQIEGLDLPEQAIEIFTDHDTKKAASLANSGFVQSHPFYQNEVAHFIRHKVKVELEALHSHGIDFLSNFLYTTLRQSV